MQCYLGTRRLARGIKGACANFSTLVDKAVSDGPQIVTRNGKKTARQKSGNAVNAAPATLSNSSTTHRWVKRV
jgi:hypothetical protein